MRFSRIFESNLKSTYKNQIWWPSKTFKKEGNSNKNVEETINKTESLLSDKLKLNIGSPPKIEDCMIDERVSVILIKKIK